MMGNTGIPATIRFWVDGGNLSPHDKEISGLRQRAAQAEAALAGREKDYLTLIEARERAEQLVDERDEKIEELEAALAETLDQLHSERHWAEEYQGKWHRAEDLVSDALLRIAQLNTTIEGQMAQLAERTAERDVLVKQLNTAADVEGLLMRERDVLAAQVEEMRNVLGPMVGMLHVVKDAMDKAEKVDRRTYEVTCGLIKRGERAFEIGKQGARCQPMTNLQATHRA